MNRPDEVTFSKLEPYSLVCMGRAPHLPDLSLNRCWWFQGFQKLCAMDSDETRQNTRLYQHFLISFNRWIDCLLSSTVASFPSSNQDTLRTTSKSQQWNALDSPVVGRRLLWSLTRRLGKVRTQTRTNNGSETFIYRLESRKEEEEKYNTEIQFRWEVRGTPCMFLPNNYFFLFISIYMANFNIAIT